MLRLIKFILILAIIISLFGWLSFRYEIDNPINKDAQAKMFVIETGQSVGEIGKNLAQEGIIRSSLYFKLYVLKEKLEDKIQAGTYSIGQNLSIKKIVEKIIAGEIIDQEIKITIIEGWTIEDMAEYLAKKKIVDKDRFIELTKADRELKIGNQKSEINFLEGYLFPDTYMIFANAAEEDIIAKMLNNFKKKLTKKMLADIRKQGRTLEEIIKMASLIEKEVQTKEDMKKVAGIFYNRLNSNIKLESDATLSYVLRDKVAAHTYDDLKLDSPYNSYMYRGLPPTPISNPGASAIEAAIYPAETDYYYFLSGKNGKTYFSKTYEEHLRNKAKYLD